MKQIILLFSFFISLAAIGQVDTTITVYPSTDTTRIRLKLTNVVTTSKSVVISSTPTVQPRPIDSTTGYVRKNVAYTATFEGSDFQLPAITGSGNQYFNETSAASIGAAWSIYGVSSPVKSGTGAVRFELRKSDATASNVTSARSELTIKYSPGSYYESWMGFSVYLPSASYGTDQAPDIIHQIHANNGESPPFAIQTQNGKWQVAYNWDNGGSIQYHTIDLGIPYEKDQWVDFVYHIKLSKGTDGFIELWKNGVKIWTYNGQTQYTNVSGSNFYRIGIYKWPWTQGIASSQTVRVAYYDEVRIGNASATYYDVAPTGSAPIAGLVSFKGDWTKPLGLWATPNLQTPDLAVKDGVTWHNITSAKITIKPDSKNACDGTCERSEIAELPNGKGGLIDEGKFSGQTIYFATSYKIPLTFQSAPSSWYIPLQLHGPDGFGISPLFALDIGQKKWQLNMRRGDITVNTTNLGYAFTNGVINYDKWTDFIIAIKFAIDKTGFIVIYRRDEGQSKFTLSLSQTNIETYQFSGANGSIGYHYFKQGIYRGHTANTDNIWIGPFARATTFSDAENAAFGTNNGF